MVLEPNHFGAAIHAGAITTLLIDATWNGEDSLAATGAISTGACLRLTIRHQAFFPPWGKVSTAINANDLHS
jgi:hypothetical protein